MSSETQSASIAESETQNAALDEWYNETMRASQIEDWRAELTSLENDIKAVRDILAEKQRRAESLRVRLGLSAASANKMQAVREKSVVLLHNANVTVRSTVQHVKESDRYKQIEAKTRNVLHRFMFGSGVDNRAQTDLSRNSFGATQFGPVSKSDSDLGLSNEEPGEHVDDPYTIATDCDEEELTVNSKSSALL